MARGANAIRRFRGIGMNLGLLFGVLLILIAAGEVLVRLAEPRSDHERLVRIVPESGRMWTHLPGRDVLRNGVTVRTNAFGLRGPECALEKPPGTYRILGLGDSYTFGSGVRWEDTYLRVLENRLNARPNRAARFETLNCGVEGYNTRQELASFLEQGADLHPDLVLLGYLFNDVEKPARPRDGARWDAAPLMRRGLSGRIVKLKDRSHLFAFASPRAGALLRKAGVNRLGAIGVYSTEFRDDGPGWQDSRAALLQLREAVDKAGARFAVAIFPALTSLDRRNYPLHAYHAAVTRACREAGIPVLDLYPMFEGERGSRFWISLTDTHPNAAANGIIGEAIARFVEENGLVPGGDSLITAR